MATPNPTPPYRDTFDKDVDDGTVTAILTLAGASITLVFTLLALRSAGAFVSLRHCACNVVLLYCAVIQFIAQLNGSWTAVFVLTSSRAGLAEYPMLCQVSGGIAQATFMSHSAMGLMYLSIALMYRLGNKRARFWVFLTLFLNTVAFVGMAVYGALTDGGYEVKKRHLFCWLENGSGKFDDSYVRRFFLLYIWGIIPIIMGFICIPYILNKTWHMRAQSTTPWKMVRNRISYAFFQLLYWGFLLFERYYPDYGRDNSHHLILWGKWLGAFSTAALCGFQMMIFLYQESAYTRWKARRKGPSEDRLTFLYEEYVNSHVADRGVRSSALPDATSSSVQQLLGRSRHSSVLPPHESTGFLANDDTTHLSPNSRQPSYAGTHTTSGRQASSICVGSSKNQQSVRDPAAVDRLIEREKKDPFVHKQLSEILDGMGPGAKPSERGPRSTGRNEGRSRATRSEGAASDGDQGKAYYQAGRAKNFGPDLDNESDQAFLGEDSDDE